MPRAETKQHLGTQFYHSQFSNSQYLPSATESTGSSSPPLSPSSPAQSALSTTSSTTSAAKKKHLCGTCERAFTTSGHLARHSRVHTGERNHKCPFPGCETRCSRQDNLQQHYRIHLSPGSRRSSARSARAKRAPSNTASTTPSEPPSAPPPLSSPPALETARVYNHATPPDSPPPLAQATLPATATLPLSTPRLEPASGRSSSSSSPEMSYSSNGIPMSSQALNLASPNPQGYAYRSGTTTYQEQSQSAGFTYVHTTPVNGSQNNSNGTPSYHSSYANSHDGYAMQPQPHHHTRDNSPISSRHSISHISHPQSYSQSQSSSASPPSPASSHSVSSHTSGPPTPTYPVFHDDTHSYHHGNGMIADHSGLNSAHAHAHLGSQSHLVHAGYSSNGVAQQQQQQRFGSPPPVLAPIQDERLIRREEQRHSHSHNPSPYIHHPQPLPTEYSYHQTMALGHGAWKAESGMRKGVGATLV